MKKLLLLSLVIVECDLLQEEDCAGVTGGTAVTDICGVCTGGTTNLEINYLEDCQGVCGGDAQLDNCNICDNDPTNDCQIDCADTWGGDDVEQTYYLDGDGDGLGSNTAQELCSALGTTDTGGCIGIDCWVSNTDDQDDHCYSNIFDCAELCDGNAIMIPYYIDVDQDSLGFGTAIDKCDALVTDEWLENYVTNHDDQYPTCTSNLVDSCGVCDGNNSPNTGTCDCALVQNGTAFYDNCGNCVFGTTGSLPCYELIFSDDFTAQDQILPNTSSSNWRYIEDHYESINISNNKLVLKGIDDGNAHPIYDNVISKSPYKTKLIDKFEFSVDIGHISYASGSWIYGIFIEDQNSELRYHMFFFPRLNGNLACALTYYDYESEEWIDIYYQSISSSTYDISLINFKLTYDESTLKGYLDNENLFSHEILNFQCEGYGIYSQKDGGMWIDNANIYGRQVDASLGGSSRKSIHMSPHAQLIQYRTETKR